MKHPPLSPALRAAGVLVSLSILVVSPAYGQSCTPSAESGEAARSGASLTNPAGGSIVVGRRGERGLDATESATNHGTVITCGEVHEYVRDDGSPARRRAHAVNVDSESGDATATNSGLIETHGRGARGLQTWTNVDTGTARTTNRGRVVTRGDVYDGRAHFGRSHFRTTDGVAAFTGPRSTGDAIAINERSPANDPQSGVIEVHGRGARGIWAYTEGTGEARGINRGTITTRGNAFEQYRIGGEAAGIAAESLAGSATAINERGATIRALGDGVQGLFAAIYDTREASAGGRAARAENHGTIDVSGSTLLGNEYDEDGNFEDAEVLRATTGVYAHADSGSAVVLNTGNVTATGRNAIGLYAGDFGSFDSDDDEEFADDDVMNATVRMTGGSVVAGARDDPTTPRDESRNGFGILVVSESGSARVYLSGDSTTVTAHGATTDDPHTDWDERVGIGINAFGDFSEDCYAPPPPPRW